MPRNDRHLTAGVDVASYQHKRGDPINWPVVASQGYEFAIVKLTEATSYRNPFFTADWNGSKDAGLLRGAYHFADPDHNAARDEAKFFVDSLPTLEVGDLVALDMERGSGNLAEWSLEWLRSVQEQVGFRPLFYSRQSFMDPHGRTGNPDLAEFGLWLARYRAEWPPIPAVWPFIAIWQYSSTGQVDGMHADAVDLDFFNGPRDRLALYGKPPAQLVSEPLPVLEEVPPGSYVMRAADTLATIVSATSSSREEIEQSNSGLDLAELSMGTLVSLPERVVGRTSLDGSQTYTARASTNLADVAHKLGLDILALEAANPQLVDQELIEPGVALNVPATNN